MALIEVGSRWQRKRTSGRQQDVVEVARVTPNNVAFKERSARQHSLPIALFLGQFELLTNGRHTCERCGSSDLRLVDKYCRACLALIMRVRSARARAESGAEKIEEQEEPVLTTADSRLIEERRAQQGATHVPNGQPKQPPGVLHWHITGRRVVIQEQSYEIEARDVISALGELEVLAPGLEVTMVQLVEDV